MAKHTSVALDTPIEFINITSISPLISKCEIKVCYVDNNPNRNKSVITKEVAKGLANSLPGSPIVGYYSQGKEDYEEHNRIIEISGGKFKMTDTTKPYGFVDLGAKVWFQKFLDDESVEREYLVTEGWLWTSQYPECQRVIENGNNHSMEIDEASLVGNWTKDANGKPKFFIVNEAIISKLCILGENEEPCFEGSTITAPKMTFAFEDDFKEKLFSMMNELKELMNKGGEKMFTKYSVDIGDNLWNALYSYIDTTYPDNSNNWYGSIYRIDGVYEENNQKFAVLQHRQDLKYYRLNFALNDESGFVPSEGLIEVTKTYIPSEEPQFAEEAVQQYAAQLKAPEEQGAEQEENNENSEENQDKTDKEENNNSDNTSEEENTTFAKTEEKDEEDEEKKCPKCHKPVDECECEDKDEEKVKKYSLEEIPEYIELKNQYSELESKYNALLAEKETLENTNKSLSEFKLNAERKEKEEMISSFYMLSDEDKADVVSNIDTYSLGDIEAKLAVICVRNKVSFKTEEEKPQGPTTYNLDEQEDTSTPAWVKRALAVAENMK